MYIAFKWLVLLALAMWLSLCCINEFANRNKTHTTDSTSMKPTSVYRYENASKSAAKLRVHKRRVENPKIGDHGVNSLAIFHYIMFLAGAIAVTILNKKTEIILFTKSKMSKINIKPAIEYSRKSLQKLNKTAIVTGVAILKYIQIIWENSKITVTKMRIKFKNRELSHKLNLLLLKKLSNVGEERDKLTHLLVAAVQANKTIRFQHQLETMARNRLIRHIEVTQKQIKENRARYVNFQQLYIMTHQENLFLNARLRKLSNDKEDAEKKLMRVINEIYKSNNNALKAYCSRLIVQTKDNLLNSDVSAEIQKFKQRPRYPIIASTSSWQLGDDTNISLNITKSWPSTRITEIISQEENLPLQSAPKLRGLPGEYVWTVKDKDGFIEKLYEYDCGYNFDNNEAINRIREYSVYHDKDCLLDFSNSTIIPESNDNTTISENLNLNPDGTSKCSRTIASKTKSLETQPGPLLQHIDPTVDFPASQRFLSDSEPFQTFLKNNKNVGSMRSRSRAPIFVS